MGTMCRRNILYSGALPRHPARRHYHPERTDTSVDFPPLWHPPFRHGDENEVQTVAFALHRRAWHAPDVLLSVGFLAPEGDKAVVPGAWRLGPLLPLKMVKFRLLVQLGTYLDVRCCTRWVLSSFSFYIMPRKDGVQKNGRQPAIFEYLSCLTADRI